jgi:tetratricopeptide (TPR) repeat protein
MLADDLVAQTDAEHAFGVLLTTLRSRVRGKKVKQKDIVARLPGWTISSYSRLENGELAPRFDQLLLLYQAFRQVNIPFSPDARQQFVDLARKRIAIQKTHKDTRSDAEWAQLRFELARLDGLHDGSTDRVSLISKPLLTETSHLVGREQWRKELLDVLGEPHYTKLVVIRGPAGIGKSSELNWLATYLFRQKPSFSRVILCDFRSEERPLAPEEALDVVLGTILAELRCPLPDLSHTGVEERTLLTLDQLEQAQHHVMVLVDHCEYLLSDKGLLAPCWERFLSKFLRSQHRATLLLATRQWPGWYGGEHRFVAEHPIPPLPPDEGILLLQQLGLDTLPVPVLRDMYDKIGGIPLCLEWGAALVKQPFYADDWEEFDARGQDATNLASDNADGLMRSARRLLAEPHIFGGSLASAMGPILDRVIANQSLSADARNLLQVLSVAFVPLAKPALAVICPAGPRPLEELRRASLIVAYLNRAYLLPMVASAVIRHLTDEQIQENEHLLMQAYTAWLADGVFYEHESGTVVVELSTLLLKHRRLLDTAQLLLRYGWLAFNQGRASSLARLATTVMESFYWHATEENECGGLLLHDFLSPFLGKPIDAMKKAADYRHIRDMALGGKVMLQPPIEVAITYHLMVCAMNDLHFEEAQALLEECCYRLQSPQKSNLDLQASLLEKRAWLVGRWGEYAEEQGEMQRARELQEQAIAINRQIIDLLRTNEERSLLERSFLNKRLARAFNNLGYHLNRVGQYEEALQIMDQCIILKEQGYVEVDTLADAYGEKSQILASLGRFQEALLFDEKAYAETQRLANAGYSFSKEELWTYRVNRGCLYLRLGRVDEAEQLLREALPHIQPTRSMYCMFANNALDEIEQWRLKSAAPHYQLDWRWVERYRILASFDSYWWLAPAGPFTEEERQQWAQLYSTHMDEVAKEQLGTLIAESRERELAAAIAEQREPQLHYPAIDITDVRSRIAGLLQLHGEISEQEPNAIVRRLYQDTIEEEVDFLRLIEAAYEKDSERFWEYNLRLNPIPTREEMNYTLSRVRHIILQGLLHPETAEASERVIQFVRDQLGFSLDLSYDEQEAQELQKNIPLSSSAPRRMVSPQTARRFFEAVLQKGGYEGWQVVIDHNASVPRIEQGLRHVYLPDGPISVNQIKHDVSHELAGHVARCIAGERSALGLLGIHTKHSLETEEGLATYQDMQTAELLGQPHDETGIWFGTLATGLASGVLTPPQTFLSLFAFFEAFIFLYRLLKRPDQDAQTAQQYARKLAIARALRSYRGVPDLTRAGVCYSKDALYLRGLWKIEQALAQDESVLDRLAVGVVALEQLPDLKELGIGTAPQPLRKLAQDPDLDAYILSFEEPQTPPIQQGEAV